MLTDNQAKSLYDVLTRGSIKDFYKEGTAMFSTTPGKENESYVFIDGGPEAKVLAVGHCDYVMFSKPKMNEERTKVACPQLDDRLGVWLILKFLKAALPKDLPYDILLTDYEEKGNSTAKLFQTPEGKKYNWMFEFDRMGVDTVMYSYHTPELKKLLEDNKFEVGHGSYTDICYLTQLGCAGFNFGVGYHGQHTNSCYADLHETASQVGKFLKFYPKYYNTHLEGDTKKAKESYERRTNPSKYYGSNHTNYGNGYRGYNPDPLTKDSILYITQYGGAHAKPQIQKSKPYTEEFIIGVCTMKGEVLAYPKDRHTKALIKQLEVGHGIDDEWLGEKIPTKNKWYFDTTLKLVGKKRVNKTADKSIIELAKAYKKYIIERGVILPDGNNTTIKGHTWIDDEMIQDWETEAQARLIIDDPFEEDDRLPTDTELEMLYNTGELIVDNFPGGKEAQKEILKPDV